MATINDELTRIENAKTNIKTSIENKGVSVPTGTLLSAMPSYINQIPVLDPDDFVQKSGDTMTGDLNFASGADLVVPVGSNISFGSYNYCSIYANDSYTLKLQGEVGSLTLGPSAKGSSLSAGGELLLSGDNNQILMNYSGIYVDSYTDTGYGPSGFEPGYGYYKFPVEDGSSSGAGRYTIATQEWVNDQLPSFTSITEVQTTTEHSTEISNSTRGPIPAIMPAARFHVNTSSSNASIKASVSTSSTATLREVELTPSAFTYNSENIATQPWVQSNQKYTITVSNGVMTVKENY